MAKTNQSNWEISSQFRTFTTPCPIMFLTIVMDCNLVAETQMLNKELIIMIQALAKTIGWNVNIQLAHGPQIPEQGCRLSRELEKNKD